MEKLSELEKIIGYEFKNKENISVAIVHPGANKFDRDFAKHFERLEFLGDRVLGLSLAYLIFSKFKKESEGDLAVRMSVLAGTDFLIDLAKKTRLIECFSYPKDLFVSKNKNSSSIADMMEAVLGSVFLDSGFPEAREVVTRLWGDDLDKVIYKKKDSKTRLQEIVQSRSEELPFYRLVKMSGEAHDPVFEIEVSACGEVASGFGNSKKNAEHDAAKKLIEKLSK
ncbi:MAG: ribonuclease III [Alphaproteobacteria bacterium]|nr:ribonuclease III [Alphaproteobacteria bacterium]